MHIAQVLLNLLRNAGHATPESGQVIVRLNQENRHALIECRILAEALNGNIWRKSGNHFFHQGRAGLGLGLDICRKIIQTTRAGLPVTVNQAKEPPLPLLSPVNITEIINFTPFKSIEKLKIHIYNRMNLCYNRKSCKHKRR